jgi:hypothetical protein
MTDQVEGCAVVESDCLGGNWERPSSCNQRPNASRIYRLSNHTENVPVSAGGLGRNRRWGREGRAIRGK